MDIDVICKFRNKSNFKIHDDNTVKNITTRYKKKLYKFKFNEIWDDTTSFESIYSYLNSNSNNYRDKNIILFGYTGSGKTYTMNNILKELINNYINNKQTYKITCFQLYNNQIFDILDNNNVLKYFKNNELKIMNPKKMYFDNFENLINIIENNRKINKTDNNDVSSRSCLIIKIKTLKESYNIIDMHGQEIGNTKNNQTLNNEAIHINLNMLALKQCITSYYEKRSYIPFRNSLLTLYLKNMFNSICKVYFICTINSDHHFFQQLDSMKYASCLIHPKKNIKNDIQNFLIEYSLYITSLSLNSHDENILFKEIKRNDFSNINKVHDYIQSNLNAITIFNKKYDLFLKNLKK